MSKRELFNARSQQVEEAELSVDHANEIVATFADGSFIKFPAGLSADEFEALIAVHQDHNEGQEVITEEKLAADAEARAASLALIGEEVDSAPADALNIPVNEDPTSEGQSHDAESAPEA